MRRRPRTTLVDPAASMAASSMPSRCGPTRLNLRRRAERLLREIKKDRKLAPRVASVVRGDTTRPIVHVRRRMRAGAEQIFDQWTKPDFMVRWMSPIRARSIARRAAPPAIDVGDMPVAPTSESPRLSCNRRRQLSSEHLRDGSDLSSRRAGIMRSVCWSSGFVSASPRMQNGPSPPQTANQRECSKKVAPGRCPEQHRGATATRLQEQVPASRKAQTGR
jgi:hypothetical protein